MKTRRKLPNRVVKLQTGRLYRIIKRSEFLQGSSSAAEVRKEDTKDSPVLFTGILETGETVQVSLEELEDFLDNNSDKLVPQFRPVKGKRRN